MPAQAPPPTLHPMKDFDPSEPAILHDRISDAIIAWSGEEADAFRRSCVEREDGTLAWNGYEFDGWGNVLGGLRAGWPAEANLATAVPRRIGRLEGRL